MFPTQMTDWQTQPRIQVVAIARSLDGKTAVSTVVPFTVH
jgi:hypothetical protein